MTVKEALRSESALADFMYRCASYSDARRKAAALWTPIHRLIHLAEILIDNDPNEPIADNGMTVIDGWRLDAKAAVARLRGGHDAVPAEPRSSSALLRIAMRKHEITREALIDRLENEERLPLSSAELLVDCFVDGGPCAIVVAATLICLIAEKAQ